MGVDVGWLDHPTLGLTRPFVWEEKGHTLHPRAPVVSAALAAGGLALVFKPGRRLCRWGVREAVGSRGLVPRAGRSGLHPLASLPSPRRPQGLKCLPEGPPCSHSWGQGRPRP